MVKTGKRIATLRKAAGLTQGELAKKVEVAQPTVSKWERDVHPPTAEDLQKIAVLFGVEPKDILGFGMVEPGSGRRIEVVGALQAGEFAEAIEFDESERYYATVALDPDLDRYPMQGYVVRGDSMNRIYPDGSVVWVTPIHAIGPLINGDIVMVMRRDKHGLVEATLKEYVEEDGHKWLWPRSTSPLHQTPIDYAKGRSGEVEEVIITGVVMAGTIRSRTR